MRAASNLASGVVRDDIEDEEFSVPSVIARGRGNSLGEAHSRNPIRGQ